MIWPRRKVCPRHSFKNELDQIIYVWVEPNCLSFELHPGETLSVRSTIPAGDAGLEPFPLSLGKDRDGELLLTVCDHTTLTSEFLIDDALIAREWTMTAEGLSRTQ